MVFTYQAYKKLIDCLNENNYKVVNYDNFNECEKVVILRHDIDYSLDKAVELAEFEKNIGVSTTYFILVSSDFYNIFSKKSKYQINRIIELGHNIGLHFDEARYEGDFDISEKILSEKEILEKVIFPNKVRCVSMHRPSKNTLEANFEIPGMINSYGKMFFNEFKYVSDSRRCWREDVMSIVKSGEYSRLHILTHAFWYFDEEKDIRTTILDFIDEAKQYRYDLLKDNITDLDGILKG